ncbi:MAG: hypothetical protein AAF456_01885 [Planctomycetota bacterium]
MNRIIGNRATEKDVRDWLNNNGYYGRSAKFQQLELHAIQRPGWKQVFRFTVEAKRKPSSDEGEETKDGEWVTLFGVVRDDERNEIRNRETTSICVFTEADDRNDFLNACSRGMMVQGTRSEDNPFWIVAGGILLLVILIVVLRLFQ